VELGDDRRKRAAMGSSEEEEEAAAVDSTAKAGEDNFDERGGLDIVGEVDSRGCSSGFA